MSELESVVVRRSSYNSHDDVEIQRSLLLVDEEEEKGGGGGSSLGLWRVLFLVFHSAQLFMTSPMTTVADYTTIVINHDDHPTPPDHDSCSTTSCTTTAAAATAIDDEQEHVVVQVPLLTQIPNNMSVDEEEEAEEERKGGTAAAAALDPWRRLSLIFHSVQLFKAKATTYVANATPHSLSSSSSAVDSTTILIHEEEEIMDTHQDEGIATLAEIVSADSDGKNRLSFNSHERNQNDICDDRVLKQRKAISQIVKSRNVQELENKFGGVSGVAHALNTDLEHGNIPSTVQGNHTYFLTDQQPQLFVHFFRCFLKAWNSYPIILLVVASTLSIAFETKDQGWANGWVNGAIVMLIAFALVAVNTLRNYFQEKSSLDKFQACLLSVWRGNSQVIRDGNPHNVPAVALRVGDLVVLNRGSMLHAEGIYVSGEGLEVEGDSKSTLVDETSPFLLCGWRVIAGKGSMIVTSVGLETELGEMMMSQAKVSCKCKFETCLNKVNSCIQTTGIVESILINIVLFILYALGKRGDDGGFKTNPSGDPTPLKIILDAMKEIISGSSFWTRKVLTLLSVSLVGAMEGIPVVVSLAAAYGSGKILAHKASETDFLACLKMASVTTICTEKLGGLTEHEEEVYVFLFGEEIVSDGSQLCSSTDVLEDLCDGINMLLLVPQVVCGSKVAAIVSWAETTIGLKRGSLNEQYCNGPENEVGKNPFVECSRVQMTKNGREGRTEYWYYRGPPGDIMSLCSHYYNRDGEIQEIDDLKESMFEDVVRRNQAFQAEGEALAFACTTSLIESNTIILLGMIGLKSTKREETKRSVLTLRDSGTRVILTSKDDVEVLKKIGQESGILTPDSVDLAIRGEDFRGWDDEQKNTEIEKICIMGNCRPSDKIDLLKCLKQNGQVVAMVGQRTIDAPALKEADIGLTLGSWSSEVARQSSGIHIFNGDFSFLVSLINEGKRFRKNIQNFVQLQVIFSISSSFVSFLATVVFGDSPVTAVELFWSNSVLAVAGGFALLFGPPTNGVPTKLSRVFVTKAMWRNIVIQASYQIVVFVSLQSGKGQDILGLRDDDAIKSMIYLGFCLCQFFNIFLAREPEQKNIFRGLFEVKDQIMFFVGLVLFVVLQGSFLVVERSLSDSACLNWKLLSVCFVIGIVSWLLDFAGKCMSRFK